MSEDQKRLILLEFKEDYKLKIKRMVGTSGIEPPTTTMSRWCSTTELRAYKEPLRKPQEVIPQLNENGLYRPKIKKQLKKSIFFYK